MAHLLLDSSGRDCDNQTGSDANENHLKRDLNLEEVDHRKKLAKFDLGATPGAIQDENDIPLELACPEAETREMPVLLPHYASKEFRKLKPRKKKSRYPVLVNVKTKESVGKTKQVWCMICDRFFPSLEVLRSHIVVQHRKEPIGLNEDTTATWNILHLVGLPPQVLREKGETPPAAK